jgi:predicted nucleotidyltransferase
MGTTRPPLLPLFRSQTQLDLLAAVFSAPAPIAVGDLAERMGAPISTVSREVARLADAGVLRVVASGRAKLVEARRDHAWAPALAELLDRTVGIAAVVAETFGGLDDVDQVAVFGSWAERRLGRLGPPPRDIDVLVVGTPAAFEVASAAQAASRRLGLEVSPTVVSPEAWADPRQDPVLRAVKRGPLVVVAGDGA